MVKPKKVCITFKNGTDLEFEFPLCLVAQEFLLKLVKEEADHPIKEK